MMGAEKSTAAPNNSSNNSDDALAKRYITECGIEFTVPQDYFSISNCITPHPLKPRDSSLATLWHHAGFNKWVQFRALKTSWDDCEVIPKHFVDYAFKDMGIDAQNVVDNYDQMVEMKPDGWYIGLVRFLMRLNNFDNFDAFRSCFEARPDHLIEFIGIAFVLNGFKPTYKDIVEMKHGLVLILFPHWERIVNRVTEANVPKFNVKGEVEESHRKCLVPKEPDDEDEDDIEEQEDGDAGVEVDVDMSDKGDSGSVACA